MRAFFFFLQSVPFDWKTWLVLSQCGVTGVAAFREIGSRRGRTRAGQARRRGEIIKIYRANGTLCISDKSKIRGWILRPSRCERVIYYNTTAPYRCRITVSVPTSVESGTSKRKKFCETEFVRFVVRRKFLLDLVLCFFFFSFFCARKKISERYKLR